MLRTVRAEHHEADQVTRHSLDRAYGEMLQEARIAQTPDRLCWRSCCGLPSVLRFTNQDRFGRHLWLASVVLSLAPLALLTAPGCCHRPSHPRASKKRLLALANAYTAGGMALLFASIAFAVLLILGATLASLPWSCSACWRSWAG